MCTDYMNSPHHCCNFSVPSQRHVARIGVQPSPSLHPPCGLLTLAEKPLPLRSPDCQWVRCGGKGWRDRMRGGNACSCGTCCQSDSLQRIIIYHNHRSFLLPKPCHFKMSAHELCTTTIPGLRVWMHWVHCLLCVSTDRSSCSDKQIKLCFDQWQVRTHVRSCEHRVR